MAVITWRGVSGAWASLADWRGFAAPGSGDVALFASGDGGTATLDAQASAGGVTLAAGTLATLLVTARLDLGGTLALAGGTLALSAGGTIAGGTVALAGGTLLASSGVADGVTWLGTLGNGLAVTAATATATQAALGTLAIAGALTLEAGSYANARFGAALHDAPSATLAVADGAVATLGPGATLSISASDPAHAPQVAPSYSGLALAGAGTLVNAGLITSDLSAVLLPLAVTAAEFDNTGRIALSPAIVPDVQQTFLVTQGGRIPVPVTLTFDQSYAPGLILRGDSFRNTGTITGAGVTLLVQGETFTNTGVVSLGSLATQIPFHDGTTAYVTTLAVGSSIDIAAGVTSFSNSGVLGAAGIVFEGDVTLAQLGRLRGDITFRGTVDLQGGTLDAALFDPGHAITFAGTVRDGTLIVDGGTLVTGGATLEGVTVRALPPVTLLNVTSGSVVLNEATTELAYTTAATVTSLAVVAGVPGTLNRIGARAAGNLTFGAGTVIADVVAGSTLAIGGPGTFVENGQIVLDGAVLDIATLDGTGTISLADGAALAVGVLAPTSAVTVAFGAGANLLSLPPSGASGVNQLGLTLAGLSSGDLIDFAGVSSQPVIGDPFGEGGVAYRDGTLYVQGASGEQARVAVASASAGLVFSAGADGAGGTLVSVACFREGTRLATPGGEIAVERLRIGQRVLTASGRARKIRWIGRRRYRATTVAAQAQLRPVRVAAGALGGGLPRRALDVSPLHGLWLAEGDGPGVLVPAAALLGCPGIGRAPVGDVAYLHIELATPDLLLAEGAATESFVDRDSRALFENAATFVATRPATRASPVPRVEGGWRLHALRTRLCGAGAGVTAVGARPRWAIDRDADGRIEGWVTDDAAPQAPVALALFDGAARIACAVANEYRLDLDRARVGDGRCAFTLDVPPSAWPRRALRTLAGAVLLAH